MTTAFPVNPDSAAQGAGKHMANNAQHTLPPSYDGRNGRGPSSGPVPLPHIDDVVAYPRDIDANLSIKRLLDLADTALRQSEMSRDFNRPATALRDYIRASVIAIQIVKDHRDYIILKSERGALSQKHSALLKRINDQSDIFDRIKRDIIADNKRSGTLPLTKRASENGNKENIGGLPSTNVPTASKISMGARANGHVSSQSITSTGTNKPIVAPKPQSLQGKTTSLHGRSASVSTVNQDLAARFANLRGPQASPGQDPRIKTHPIPQSKPAGPREMPPPPRPKVDTANSVPLLPKMPDAIYSPLRPSNSGEASRQPPSTPKIGFSRSGSSASINSTPSVLYQQQNDYFPPVQSYSQSSANTGSSTSEAQLLFPEKSTTLQSGDGITPEELFEAMKEKGSVLIIDIRAREDFDEGHIMSSSTICIEPSILLRDSLSADDISESMVLSPNQEQSYFDRRGQYDIVVFYDQDSKEIPRSARNSDELVIISLHRALVHLSYGRELKHPPKILRGGLEAWVELMGTAALQSTSVSTGSSAVLPTRRQNANFKRRRSKYLVRPLRPDEVRVWQEALDKEEITTAQSPTLHRSTESFLRRYPPVLLEQESMTSGPVTDTKPRYGTSHKHDLTSDLPSPPARPAPAVPRSNTSSLSLVSEHEHVLNETGLTPAGRPAMRSAKTSEQLSGEGAKYYTGLNNPHNWCYANSTLQSLLASPSFGRDLANSTWKRQYSSPRKADEKMDNPQFMIKFISNLFHWMSTGKFRVMKAQALMDYSRHLCKQSHSPAQFGGVQQQDAQEFMSFVMEHIHDETNSQRDRKGNPPQPNTKSQSLIKASAEYWRSHLDFNQSIVDRYWRGLELSTVDCLQCHNKTYTFSPFEWIPAPVTTGRGQTLEQALRQHVSNNTLDDFSCDKCRCNTKAMQAISFARLPPLLCVCFRRFNYNQSTGDIKKSTTPVTWDFNDFDFSPYFLDAGATTASNGDRAFEGPFRYECYAVIVHAGSRTDNGHYYVYVRDSSTHDPYAWLCCNDTRVTRVRIGSGDRDDVQDDVFRSGQDCVPYLVFFRRKGG